MVVAAGALERQTQHRRAEGMIAVGNILDSKLLRNAASLDLLRVQSVKGRRQPLVVGGVGQQVAGQLPS